MGTFKKFHRVAFLLAILLSSTVSDATERIALVIGNGRYAVAPLKNPVNDARLIRDTLQGVGFTVRYIENADRATMVRSIQALGRDLSAAGRSGVGLFYFSGHGVQSGGQNYLLPIGGRIDTEADLLPEAVDADWVLKQMEQAGTPLNILILDACRNNALAVSSKSATKGLARMVAPVGSVLAFATDSGTVAYDGKGANSPYATALSRYMKEPGLELKAMFDQVAQSVHGETSSETVPQVPVQLYKLTPKFYFKPAAPAEQASLSRPMGTPTPAPTYGSSSAALVQNQQAVSEVLLRPSSLADLPPGTVFKDCADCPEMVRIPTGRFEMGSRRDEDDRQDEKPVHDVSISYALAAGKFEVTRGQLRQFLIESGNKYLDVCSFFDEKAWKPQAGLSWSNPGYAQDDNHPGVCITWQWAKDYTAWLSRKTGRKYRLLSEAEFEYVNRAGSRTLWFWGSDGLQDSCRYANVLDAHLVRRRGWTADKPLCDDGHENTSPVGRYQANGFGLHDTTGNVWEWTEDCWNQAYTGAPSNGSAWEAGDCSRRVVRGGSWLNQPVEQRSASRSGLYARAPLNNQGFRLARVD